MNVFSAPLIRVLMQSGCFADFDGFELFSEPIFERILDDVMFEISNAVFGS